MSTNSTLDWLIKMIVIQLTFHDVLIGEHGSSLGRGESKVGKTHGGGQTEGDCEPAETASDEAPNALEWRGVSFECREKPCAAIFKYVIIVSH